MSLTEPLHSNGRYDLNDPILNRGTAFTRAERVARGIEGLLPYDVESLDEQLERVRDKFDRAETPLDKHVLLRAQQDSNETLFYAFVQQNLAETLPIIYTPTVGEGCQRFSHIYRHPRGLFLSYPDRGRIDEILARVDAPVRAAVVTDGERILGLGDQGIGGMGIPIGKLSLYSACAGLHPATTLPVLLDVGTNNEQLLADPLYMGWRHERVDGEDYLGFVDEFVESFRLRFPNALLQWEDFATRHASTLLHRHRSTVLSFNDDIQGTAAVALAALRGATQQSGVDYAEHRFVFVGAGSAGTGIARMVRDALEATGHRSAEPSVVLTDDHGLIHDGRHDLTPDQRDLAYPASLLTAWSSADVPPLDAVVKHVRPTVLVGVSGQAGLFTRALIEAMASWCQRPIVMPLSNPTDRAEATPVDLAAWTEGRAIVATGSPFDDVQYEGRTLPVAQANNIYVFPGVALGALAVGATEVTNAMFQAAAAAVAACTTEDDPVLPPLTAIRDVSRAVAVAVAESAVASGITSRPDGIVVSELIDGLIWMPVYPKESS